MYFYPVVGAQPGLRRFLVNVCMKSGPSSRAVPKSGIWKSLRLTSAVLTAPSANLLITALRSCEERMHDAVVAPTATTASNVHTGHSSHSNTDSK